MTGSENSDRRIQGMRIYPDSSGNLFFGEPCVYGRDGDGNWWCRPPKGGCGILGDHQVTEHEDGTITVSPSILMPGQWHGYLERGVFREC